MAKWYDRKCKDKDIKDIRGLLKVFGVSLRFRRCKVAGGTADYRASVVNIQISNKTSLRWFVSAAFHELWHVLCYRQGLYSTYHFDRMPRTRKELIKFRSVSWKAEQFVDSRASEMMKVYIPDIPYKFAYVDEDDKEWLYDNYIDKYYPIG